MKTFLRLSALAAAIVASSLPLASHAQSGTITFQGEITSATCNIAINGVTGENGTVQLPTVSQTSLPSDGATAGNTPFTFELSGCTTGTGSTSVSEVGVYFEDTGTTVDNTTGRLTNATGTATNVEVGLLNSNGSDINLTDPTSQTEYVPITGGSATLTYIAQYVATGGAATAGTVNTTVTYSLAYK